MTAAAHLDFSLRLHHNLAPPVNESFCWSPYSVFSALGLTAEAVAGETREELRAALGGELADQRRLATTAATLDDVGRTRERPELGVANTLWADQGLPVTESYLRELKEWPGSAVRTTSFRTDPESARRAINADISETTRGLIPELLRPGTVHPDTVAALVNALYLKTSWQQAFDSADTRKRVFHAPDEDHDVPMMRTTRELRYVAARGWQAVALPALGGVEAVVLLPDADRDPAGDRKRVV